MKNNLTETINSSRVSYLLLFTLLLTLTGCVHPPPVLLRNRPNVPPPIVEPTNTNQIMSVGNVGNIGKSEAKPVEIITIPVQLPPPDIKTAPITYTVKKGDSFWKVARMYGVTQEELATCNNLSLKKPLKAGTDLLIPPGGEFIPADKRPVIKKTTSRKTVKKHTSSPVKSNYVPTLQDGKYTVQAGDNLWNIARKFNTTTSLLMEANDLNSGSILQVGKTLIIPGAGDRITKQPKKKKASRKKTVKTEKVEDSQVGNEADDLLKDAEISTTEVTAPTPEESAVDVIEDLDRATEIAETETPGSLYTEEVLPNETLQDIADRHGMTPEDIIAVNPGLSADEKLKPFTSIKIPNK